MKKKVTSAGPKPIIKVKNANGTKSTFSHTSCFTSKTALESAKKEIAARGKRFTTRKSGDKVCLYEGPKRKASAVSGIGKGRKKATR